MSEIDTETIWEIETKDGLVTFDAKSLVSFLGSHSAKLEGSPEVERIVNAMFALLPTNSMSSFSIWSLVRLGFAFGYSYRTLLAKNNVQIKEKQ